MDEDTRKVEMAATAAGVIAVLDVLMAALIEIEPRWHGLLAPLLRKKIRELAADPTMGDAALVVQVALNGLEKSAWTLHRQAPQGRS